MVYSAPFLRRTRASRCTCILTRIGSDSGASAKYTTYSSNGNLVLKIGDPNQTVTGSQEYTIDYSLQNVITFYHDHDELYWDINGDQWNQPFKRVSDYIPQAGRFELLVEDPAMLHRQLWILAAKLPG